MNTNATQNSTNIKHPNDGQCPNWCVKHERYDVGHRDEGVVHIGGRRQFRHQTIEVRRDHMLRSRPGRTTVVVNDEEMTPAQAAEMGRLIVEVASSST